MQSIPDKCDVVFVGDECARLAEAASCLAAELCQRRHGHFISQTIDAIAFRTSARPYSSRSSGTSEGRPTETFPTKTRVHGTGDGVAVCEQHYLLEPRILLLEFCSELMLREEQVRLLRTFLGEFPGASTFSAGGPGSSSKHGSAFVASHIHTTPRSLCHQLLMGAGKTTVIAPLLTLMLADGQRLVTLVVPASLLHFSRQVSCTCHVILRRCTSQSSLGCSADQLARRSFVLLFRHFCSAQRLTSHLNVELSLIRAFSIASVVLLPNRALYWHRPQRSKASY